MLRVKQGECCYQQEMLLVLFAAFSLFPLCYSRNVYVEVTAPWSRSISSPLIEISEFLYQQSSSPEYFWQYIDNLCDVDQKITDHITNSANVSQSSILSTVESIGFGAASQVLSKSYSSLLETLYGLRAFAPSLKFYHSLATSINNTCGEGKSFVTVGHSSSQICNPDGLAAALQTALASDSSTHTDSNSDFDHLYPSNGPSKASKVVLYGTLGTVSFCHFHRSLKSTHAKSQFEYSVRHLSSGPVLQADTPLQGYGIFLDIKNMEYKNVDDTAHTAGGDAPVGEDGKKQVGTRFSLSFSFSFSFSLSPSRL